MSLDTVKLIQTQNDLTMLSGTDSLKCKLKASLEVGDDDVFCDTKMEVCGLCTLDAGATAGATTEFEATNTTEGKNGYPGRQ